LAALDEPPTCSLDCLDGGIQMGRVLEPEPEVPDPSELSCALVLGGVSVQGDHVP
jgi:hypothetical protein